MHWLKYNPFGVRPEDGSATLACLSKDAMLKISR